MKTGRSRVGLMAALGLAAALLPGVTGCGGARPAPSAATAVIVDTDMASDDVMALMYLLDRPDVSVRAITVEGTGVADGRAGARNVLRLIRRPDDCGTAGRIRQRPHHDIRHRRDPVPRSGRSPNRGPGRPAAVPGAGARFR